MSGRKPWNVRVRVRLAEEGVPASGLETVGESEGTYRAVCIDIDAKLWAAMLTGAALAGVPADQFCERALVGYLADVGGELE